MGMAWPLESLRLNRHRPNNPVQQAQVSMVTWDWYYTVAGVVAVEMVYLFARYMYGDPIMRRRVYEQLWAYILAWTAIAGIIAVYEDRQVLSNAILTAFGLPKPQSISVWYVDYLLTQEIASWGSYWVGYAALRMVSSSGIPIASGLAGGIATFLSSWVSLQWDSFEWFVADLAILEVLTMFYEYSTRYGLFAVYVSFVIPRSTRPIGASLTAYYLVLSIMLPVFFGMVLYEMPFTEPIPIYFPCNPFTAGLSKLGACVLEDLPSMIKLMLPYGTGVVVNIMMAPYYAYMALTWDLLLDLAYALSWVIAYWVANLIDTGAFRLLEEVTG